MKINERFTQHIEAKKAELDALLGRAIETAAAGWREEVITQAIELQKEISAAEAVMTAVLKKEISQ